MRPISSIRRKVTLALLAALGPLLATAGFSLALFEYRAADVRARSTLGLLSETIAPSLMASLDFDSPETATEILGRLAPGETVVGATVFRLAPPQPPRFFARYQRAGTTLLFETVPRPSVEFVRSGSRAILVYTITSDKRPVALLLLEADIAVFRRGIAETLFFLGIVLIVLVVASVLVSRILQRVLTLPLVRLAETAAKVHETGDFSLRAPVTTADEVGRLAAGFNELLAGIGTRDRELAEQSSFQQAVLENAGFAIIAAGPDSVIRSFNAAAERMLGYRREELIGRATPRVFMDPAELAQRSAESARRLGHEPKDGVSFFPDLARHGPSALEWTYVRKDGSHCPVLLVLSEIRTGDGRWLGLCGIATDLTERKAAETKVLQSERKFSAIFDQSPDMIGVTRLSNGTVLDINRHFERLTGWKREEAIGRSTVVLGIWPDVPTRDKVVTEAVARGELLGYELTWRTRAGEARIGLLSMRPIVLEHERCLVFVLRDITERKAAEQLLRSSEERFRIVAEQTGQMIFDHDLATGATFWIGAVQALTGYTPAELSDRDNAWWSERIHPDDRVRFAASLQSFLFAESKGQVGYRFRHASGRWIYLEGGHTVLRDLAGRPYRILGAFADATERRRADLAIRGLTEGTAGVTGQAFFDATVAQLAGELDVRWALIGNFVVEGGVRCLHPLASWGGAPAENLDFPIEGTPCEKIAEGGICQVDSGLREQFPTARRLIELGAVSYFGTAIRSRDSRICGVLAVFDDKPMVAAPATRVLLAVSAVRAGAEIERLENEGAIRRLNAELEQRVSDRTAELDRAAVRLQEANTSLLVANQELEAFSYSVSHDLRAPLRNIAGFIELLGRRTAGKLDPESARYFGIIGGESVRMGRLIDDLLAFSRIGRAELKLAAVQLSELVVEVQHELAGELAGRNVEWRMQTLPEVLGDRVLLRQVVANLLGNAVKFTRGRDPAVIEIGSLPPAPGGGLPVFFVRDNGAGFDPKYVDKLFRVFQRLHNARDFEGTGIGLANVKRIVTRHGGTVWAEGRPGAGATFFFTLRPAQP